eukprot:SAG31_NODE_8162_length_1506_cov_1.424307_1_plen_148_part_00
MESDNSEQHLSASEIETPTISSSAVDPGSAADAVLAIGGANDSVAAAPFIGGANDSVAAAPYHLSPQKQSRGSVGQAYCAADVGSGDDQPQYRALQSLRDLCDSGADSNQALRFVTYPQPTIHSDAWCKELCLFAQACCRRRCISKM